MRQEAGAYAKNTAAASTPATVAKTDTPSASAAPLVSVEPLLVPFVLALELPDGAALAVPRAVDIVPVAEPVA